MFLDFYNGDKFSYCELMAWQKYADVTLEYREIELIRQICLERQMFDYKRQQAELEYMKQQDKRGTHGRRS